MRNRTGGWLCPAAALVAVTLAATGPAKAQVAAFVNGAPITAYDIEQRIKFIQLSLHKTPTRQEVLDELIDEKIKIQEVQRYSMDAPKNELDRGLANMAGRMNMNTEQFTQALAAKGVGIETIKSRMRADMAWTNLVRARFPATLSVEEKDVADAVEKTGGEGDAVAYDYRLRQILFFVPRGSAQAVYEGRSREAEALRAKFEGCDSGIALVRSLHNVAVRDPVRKSSTDLPTNLRDILNNTPVGKLTKPEITTQGVAVWALCDKKENTTDTPQKRAARNELFNARFEAQSKRYLAEIRKQAMIEIK